MRKTIVLAAGLAVLATTGALASEPYLPRAQRSFEKVDANRDGKIAIVEFTPLAHRRLAKLDANGDKAVSQAEIETRLQEALKRRIDRMMTLMDADRNGSISEAELDKLVADMFNTADSDKDGGLSMAEVQGFKRGAWRKAFLSQMLPAKLNGN